MLLSILGGAALQRCGNHIVLSAALQGAEKLDFDSVLKGCGF